MIIPGVVAGGISGGAGYVAKAVHFDGATWLSTATALAGVADSALFSFSGWALCNTVPTNSNAFFFDIDPADNELGLLIQQNGILKYEIGGGIGGLHLGCATSAGGWAFDASWHHLFGYSNSDFPQGSKIVKLFLDGVDVTNNIDDLGDAGTTPFSTLPWAVPDSTDDWPLPLTTADYADWWIAPGVLHTDITTFRDPGTGKPKNPSGFPSSAILFSGDHTTFPTNQGTGGAFTLTGTLTNASSSPSD